MTAQGTPLSVLRRALRSGSLPAVDMALMDLPPVDLEDALEILALMAEAGDPRFPAWADRWTQRVTHEERDRLEQRLEQLPDAEVLGELRARARQLRGLHPAVRLAVGRPSDAGRAVDDETSAA